MPDRPATAEPVDRQAATTLQRANAGVGLVHPTRALRFVHYSETPHAAGHEHGFSSPAYFTAVRPGRPPARMAAQADPGPAPAASRLVMVVTAEHGGSGHDHSDADNRADYTIPFIVWGGTVTAGANLCALNPEGKRPGHGKPSYRGATANPQWGLGQPRT